MRKLDVRFKKLKDERFEKWFIETAYIGKIIPKLDTQDLCVLLGTLHTCTSEAVTELSKRDE